ncbi:amidohydrolase family protein [Pseudanabaena sp. FACHB-2040]|uniref:amidohydrolase family protein n=1 Tax=Pseudanabaena sp. FACHB-2040 TaxID=2692859 RepID=UPI001687A07B|nr:amidohydrolase family protein [Pseudanabaena sp. FACHB-2040]MBD2257021.1 amidohydrolase family protein [Pseudanabaena sp. FACHB-2040]
MAPLFEFTNCIVLYGPDLVPHHCQHFTVSGDTIDQIALGEPCYAINQGTQVIMPGMYNGHTHMGDSCLPDGATGLTLEEGFFRPHGYKYRELAKQSEAEHLTHITNHLRYMARTGTVGHFDFREQGMYGSQLLRRASESTGVRSVILGQFNELPFTSDELQHNQAALSPQAIDELKAVLAAADGFSESTMNDLTDPAWQQILTLTETAHKLRAIHCLENTAYREVSLAVTGRGDLERAIDLYRPHLVIHATVANADEISLLSEHRLNVVLNPRANANLGLPLPPIAALLQSQANLLLGTDNGLLNSPNLFAELDFTYKVAKSQFGDALHPDPADILKLVTSNVGAVLEGALEDGTCGYLAEGKPADFVVLDFTQPHLQRSRHLIASILTRVTPADVLMTVRRGNCLHA